MNSDNIILRETDHSPLVNKNDFITSAEFDANFISIYDDLVALCVTSGVLDFSSLTEYDDTINQFAMHTNRLWRFISATPATNVTPGTIGSEAYWLEIFPTDLAHRKNSDTILAEGTADEVSAAEIKAFIAAGLTSTTNLSISEHTANSFKLNSSTGSDVVIPEATPDEAGLLNAEDKVKLQQLSGTNSGDQSLDELGGEPTANKVDNLSDPNSIEFPTTNAVSTGIAQAKSDIVGAAPANLNSLEEIASSIDNDADFAATIRYEMNLAITTLPVTVKNTTGATLYKGTVVYINGVSGGVPTIAKAKADTAPTADQTIGLVQADILNNSTGSVIVEGNISTLDVRTVATNPITSVTLAVGDELFLSASTAGYITNVAPTQPNHIIRLGTVLATGATGTVYVKIDIGNHLSEDHDVLIATPTDKDLLSYETASGLWKNKTFEQSVNLTDVTTGNFSITKHGFVPKGTNVGNFLKDDGTWSSLPSSSGICGIPDSSGVYTYYATLTLAIAAATSGQTVEVFTDITETGAVSINLKNGVNINLNGHTYELSNSGTNNSFGDNNIELTCSIFNGTIKRSGATANMFNALGLYIDNVSSKVSLHGVDVVSTFGYATLTEGILIGGNHISSAVGGNYGLNCRSGSRAYRCYGYSRSSAGIYVDASDLYDSTGHSDGSDGIGTNSTAKLFNCTGRSSSGSGISMGGSGGFMQNCNAYSTSTYGLLTTGISINCSGYSSANYGYRATGDIQNGYGYSTANVGLNVEGTTAKAYNCTGVSTASYAIFCKGSLYNCVAHSLWNNAGGHAVSGGSDQFDEIFNCTLIVTNASANCLHYGSAINVKYGANIFKGATTDVNANITQTQTNAPDAYGNIKIG